ncbi:amidase family protein [Actinomadura roseirufa]|uniref:amidase family protein n=1 Tax=Actinomadura roseirufa TaxID=2094049 RepID=UPI0010418A3B|nr:amidase family protein [Actinomadura roseirufa]
MSEPFGTRDLHRRAGLLGLPVGAAEESAVLELVTDILDVVGGLDAPSDPAAAQPGWPVRDPTPEDDPLNAVTLWTDVEPTTDGPLNGMRVAVKDSVAVAGLPLSAGSALLTGFVPSTDAAAVARLRAAGARVVAVARMDEFGLSAGGDAGLGGPVRNPFDTTRTAGGSSAGCAAALHYPGVDVAIGADQGGSIRVPASWCGVLGLKPTHGLVPCTGTVGIDHTVDHVGPLARTVEDLAAVLQVIAGRDPDDPRQPRTPPPSDYLAAVGSAPSGLAGVRLGVVRQGLDGATPPVADALRRTVRNLRDLGAAVTEVDLPEHAEAGPLAFGTTVEGMAALFEAGGNGYQWSGRYWPELAARIHAAWPDQAANLGPAAKAVLIAGSHLRAAHRGERYATAQNGRPRLVAAYERALDGLDALVLPTTPGLPHPVDEPSDTERVRRGWAVLANTVPTDLTGHPALSLPLAEADGLPVGVMLVGRPFTEARLLRIAATCEQAGQFSATRPRGT